jgi:lysozyme family protein
VENADTAFQAAFEWLIQDEGTAFTNDPADHGHATRFGVTAASLGAWRGSAATDDDVRALTLEQARAFYREMYWGPLGCESLPFTTATALFDIAVLCGISRAVRFAQSALRLKPDGQLGPATTEAIRRAPPAAFIVSFAHRAADHFVRLADNDPTQARFLRGWLDRAWRLVELAI